MTVALAGAVVLAGALAPSSNWDLGLIAVLGAIAAISDLTAVETGSSKIKVSGNCVPSITSKYMLDGTIEGFYLWDPIKLGYVTYYAAKNFAEGKIAGKPGDSFTVKEGKWPGTYTIGDNGQIITGEPLQFTKDNYKDYDF